MADIFGDTLGDAAKDLAGVFGAKGLPSADQIYKEAKGLFPPGSNAAAAGASFPWFIDGTDWYKVFAYQFVVSTGGDPTVPKGKSFGDIFNKEATGGLISQLGEFAASKAPIVPKSELIYALPIPPQSLVIRMIPASQATPTVGGVVEETSGNTFWLINMSGTTGIAVTRSADGGTKRAEVAKQFRDKITTTGLMSGPLAGVNAAISKIGGIADSAIGVGAALASGDITGAINAGVDGANNALLPPLPYSGSGVDRETNGYTEAMELHRFLYTYSKLKGVKPSQYSLSFRNYKTNQEWDCILQDFQLQQSAQSPMLYKYSITLKCWGVRPPGGDRSKAEFDRFGPNGDLNQVSVIDPMQMAKLGKSMISKIKDAY